MNFLRGRTDKWYINTASPDRLCVQLPDLTLKLSKILAANVQDQKSIQNWQLFDVVVVQHLFLEVSFFSPRLKYRLL